MQPGAGGIWSRTEWQRPDEGPRLEGRLDAADLVLTDGPAWSSQGGPARGHPARAYPSLLEIPLGDPPGTLESLTLIGIFARWAGAPHEAMGTLGASLQVGAEDESYRVELVNGRHYRDARLLGEAEVANGDGTSLRQVGTVEIDGERLRVDALTVDLCTTFESIPSVIRLRDLGSPASFVIFDVFAKWRPFSGCPFHSGHGGVPLAELGSVIRLRDRVRFRKALDQLEDSLLRTEELDEARGEALTFVAVVTAATLELGAPRSMHRLQLEAARRLERATTPEAVLNEAREVIEQAVGPLLGQPDSPNARLMDRAMAIVDRQFARPLTDATIADQLGLSPSHFRFLFRQATGQPFHKYLISVRLERARKMLVEQGMPVSEVAQAVGFNGLSHFSRAFSQRFSVNPNQVRNAARG